MRFSKIRRPLAIALCMLFALPALALQLKDDAPKTYTVKKGDTLWGISSVFLSEPWLWPELWRTNTQIENPHLIYPGDVIVLTIVDGKPVLSVQRDKPSFNLSPNADKRVKPNPIDVLAWETIAPFIKQHTIIDEAAYEMLPRVLGNGDGNIVFSSNDFVLGQKQNSTEEQYRVVRKHDTITDLKGNVLGIQATHISTADVIKEGESEDAILLYIDTVNQEARRGDKLLSGGFEHPESFELKAATSTRGAVIGDLHDHDLLGRYDVVILDLGSNQVEPGTVMGIYAQGPSIINEENPRYTDEPGAKGDLFINTVHQPALKIGELIVFKTFNAASYGLITRASKGVKRGNIVANP